MFIEKERLLKDLKRLRDKGPEFPKMGICNNLLIASDLLHDAFKSWPEFSGSLGYPIKHPVLAPYEAYEEAKLRCTLWDRNTEYGVARWRLLDHCIDYFEKMSDDREGN